MTPPIINLPQRLGRSRRLAYGAATAGAWMVYFYLWAPLATLIAWFFGLRSAYTELYLKHNALDPFALGALPVIALMSAITTVGWAEYNRLRFAKADRRKRRRTVLEPEVDQRLGATEQLGSLLRHSRISSVAMDKFARPVGVRVVRHG
ncbi:poly-beta-1,6-N-acetyl-D-glucosamine biosynthesis protein PgaD [Xanthomonas hortorum pv. vitians]|uniref:Poly-beta-1,6-N-acetyl-D-glucosamine biosynthesis protein PgaD n=4 Tax=Xanthomonas hortorum TaxID=56454 RepID=A0A6V7EBZ4_9XANT|nr:poly-beta-1,6-N-acetyl-D-glucosamine biosynthesis protein PgaD [Xanthomonas hortorum]APP85068.1 poly-beta-1,6-N-acetyl-D-glucosamine biosynthesis protein PgaD [Xanthomonas hortorum pv. gardneri]ASW44979.1 poly-beta-1,6-N-acetyl-D-glucosamine biosynthesis protein PgaD [Xanthomonas hortorum]MCE4280846.1 poly-beta-1,6-N-acetyl-D-glucosamine biosynthesis protein PgaD [Xanthomonas hortorum pv. vitians]MCE4286707.1 poly-beta-1,6-N-acetyl-D-glucosamine biosynthesis protein PgaD [Xanthomonas hortoru